jgi:hypothetical protein
MNTEEVRSRVRVSRTTFARFGIFSLRQAPIMISMIADAAGARALHRALRIRASPLRDVHQECSFRHTFVVVSVTERHGPRVPRAVSFPRTHRGRFPRLAA